MRGITIIQKVVDVSESSYEQVRKCSLQSDLSVFKLCIDIATTLSVETTNRGHRVAQWYKRFANAWSLRRFSSEPLGSFLWILCPTSI